MIKFPKIINKIAKIYFLLLIKTIWYMSHAKYEINGNIWVNGNNVRIGRKFKEAKNEKVDIRLRNPTMLYTNLLKLTYLP